MKSIAHRQTQFICHLCLSSTSANKRRLIAVLAQTLTHSNTSTNSRRHYKSIAPVAPRARKSNIANTTQAFTPNVIRHTTTKAAPPGRSADPATELQDLVAEAKKISSSTSIPSELDVVKLLADCRKFAQTIIFGKIETRPAAEVEKEEDDNPTSSLLDLDESSSVKNVDSSANNLSKDFRDKTSSTISEIAYNLLRDPRVFITPLMLQTYVLTQALLGKPEYLPEIFHLYATKPIPNPGTNPVTYRQPSPRSPKNAVPLELSDAALDAAIAKKDLPLALSVIDTTVAAPAFRVNKVLRKASVPLIALGVAPACAYACATAIANYQNTYDVNIAITLAMAGMLAYIGTLGTVGFVAVTTSNDQMERVVWQPGLRLRDRWLREDERLYFDRVALAWGFKEKWRRGEEQGEDWEALREFIGRRQMVLDKTDLMDGME